MSWDPPQLGTGHFFQGQAISPGPVFPWTERRWEQSEGGDRERSWGQGKVELGRIEPWTGRFTRVS